MSLYSTIFHFSASQLTPQNSTYRISPDTYNQVLSDIKPSLVPVRTYNHLDDDILNKFANSNSDLLNDPIVIASGDDYNLLLSKAIDKFSVKNTLRTLNIDGDEDDDDQQLITDFKPQQGLLFDLFKPDDKLLTYKDSNSGDENNNILTADVPVLIALDKSYYGYGGIDTFITDKPDTYYEVSNLSTSDQITLKYPDPFYHPRPLPFPDLDSKYTNLDLLAPKANYNLHDIERVEFSNKKLAFDLQGNAGVVAKVYGAILGAGSLSDAELIGSGLKAVDDGLNAENFAVLALKSTGLESHKEIVDALWINVVGSEPTAEETQPFVNQLDSGELGIGDLVLYAANHSYNVDNIDLVGLTSHGIEFA